eukprot:4204169-Pleurochrysis_carterae.AAC.1
MHPTICKARGWNDHVQVQMRRNLHAVSEEYEAFQYAVNIDRLAARSRHVAIPGLRRAPGRDAVRPSSRRRRRRRRPSPKLTACGGAVF